MRGDVPCGRTRAYGIDGSMGIGFEGTKASECDDNGPTGSGGGDISPSDSVSDEDEVSGMSGGIRL